jgi:hypothetical protein
MADTYVFTPTYDNRAMRHAAYRTVHNVVAWTLRQRSSQGHTFMLCLGNPKVLPIPQWTIHWL